MPTAAREYVSARGLGDYDVCRQAMDEFATAVRAMNADEATRRVSFFARVLIIEDDIEDELLEPAEILAATGGVLPCLWVNITFDPRRLTVAECDVLEACFELRLTGTAQSDINYL